MSIDHGDLARAANTNVGVLAVWREAKPIDMVDHRDLGDLREFIGRDIVYVHNLVIQVAGPDFLLVRPDRQTVAAAAYGPELFTDVVRHSGKHRACFRVGYLETQQPVDLLVDSFSTPGVTPKSASASSSVTTKSPGAGGDWMVWVGSCSVVAAGSTGAT